VRNVYCPIWICLLAHPGFLAGNTPPIGTLNRLHNCVFVSLSGHIGDPDLISSIGALMRSPMHSPSTHQCFHQCTCHGAEAFTLGPCCTSHDDYGAAGTSAVISGAGIVDARDSPAAIIDRPAACSWAATSSIFRPCLTISWALVIMDVIACWRLRPLHSVFAYFARSRSA
jgi:hypothetical protein